MSLHSIIHTDLVKAMKSKDSKKVSILRYVLGEFKRLKGTKDGGSFIIGDALTDSQSIRVIKRIIDGENKLAKFTKSINTETIDLLQTYLPVQVEEKEVKEWIQNNVDFSSLNNKMQAVGLAKKHFKGSVEGSLVSEVVKNLTV